MIQMATCRLLHAYLTADVGGGVKRINDAIANVPRYAPGDLVTPALKIITHPYIPGDVDSQQCAINGEPSTFPALWLTAVGPVLAELEAGQANAPRDFVAMLALRYIVQDTDAPRTEVNAAYTMKALERVLYEFFGDPDPAVRGNSSSGGIEILYCGDGGGRVPLTLNQSKHPGITYGPWKEDLGNAVANQIMSVMIYGRDYNP